jgi:hypothetical protein
MSAEELKLEIPLIDNLAIINDLKEKLKDSEDRLKEVRLELKTIKKEGGDSNDVKLELIRVELELIRLISSIRKELNGKYLIMIMIDCRIRKTIFSKSQ